MKAMKKADDEEAPVMKSMKARKGPGIEAARSRCVRPLCLQFGFHVKHCPSLERLFQAMKAMKGMKAMKAAYLPSAAALRRIVAGRFQAMKAMKAR